VTVRDGAEDREAIADVASGAERVRIICLGLSALDQVWRVDRFFSGQS
jgi:sulfofructose kinase